MDSNWCEFVKTRVRLVKYTCISLLNWPQYLTDKWPTNDWQFNLFCRMFYRACKLPVKSSCVFFLSCSYPMSFLLFHFPFLSKTMHSTSPTCWFQSRHLLQTPVQLYMKRNCLNCKMLATLSHWDGFMWEHSGYVKS